jgi:hypothetical protein
VTEQVQMNQLIARHLIPKIEPNSTHHIDGAYNINLSGKEVGRVDFIEKYI